MPISVIEKSTTIDHTESSVSATILKTAVDITADNRAVTITSDSSDNVNAVISEQSIILSPASSTIVSATITESKVDLLPTDKEVVLALAAQGPAGRDGLGVPSGGTAGQVLAKIDSADNNTEWVDPSAGGAQSIKDLTDVSSTDTPATNDTLKWNGSEFVFVQEGTDLNFSITSFSDGQSSPQLIGSGVWRTAGELSFTASYLNGPPSLANISCSQWTNDLDIISGSAVSTESVNYVSTPNQSISFTLLTQPTDSASQSVTFTNTTLYGVVGSLSENGANENNLYTKSISPNSEQISFSYPDRLTDIKQVRINGITASFNSDRTIAIPTVQTAYSYTNSKGFSESFVSIESTDLFTGSQSVQTLSSSTPINNCYYGVSALSSLTEPDIKGLINNPVTNDNTQIWNEIIAGATDYLWFCFPVRLGAVRFFVGGFEGGFEAPQVVTVINSAGFQENYNCYRSTNINLGATTVETKV